MVSSLSMGGAAWQKDAGDGGWASRDEVTEAYPVPLS